MRNLLLVVFTLSGFSGLIYESIWSHYLKLFLGHAAYAQSLVLVIFMGGMALGAWIAGRYSLRWRNLLLVYAAIEGLIGVGGLLFHGMFTHFVDLAYTRVLPTLESAYTIQAFKWGSAGLMILPQSVLLGMTFPAMSAGLIRRYPENPGASLALLYFVNSLGAAFGVLTSGFVLISLVGLPGTILTAAIMNVSLAVVVWLVVRGRPATADLPPPVSADTQATGLGRLLLGVALATGAASFIYEIGWIRMLNLVLGTSTHAFEIMLSAFIFGLAFGGWWIRGRIDRLVNDLQFLAMVQVIMGLLALLTLPLYDYSFGFMRWLLTVLTKTDGGYTVFNIASHAIALALMLPATFCAGMTLPLITRALMRRGLGEASVGRVYAANTLGAILGVLLAVHVGLSYFGLKNTLVMGAAIDIIAGLVLYWHGWRTAGLKRPIAVSVLGAGAVLATIFGVSLDHYKMASGVYRLGELFSSQDIELLYHRDGKTATIDLFRDRNYMTVRTNGKSDAQVNLTPGEAPSPDEPAFELAGIVPLALHPSPRSAAVIGVGSGLTTQMLLDAPWITRVDTIEIEPAMVQAAHGFRPRVDAIFNDPRSHIHIEDAKTYFSVNPRRYDIIVSQPSNPWVSGVANLFSDEFYRVIKGRLNAGGLLVQWMQLYEIGTDQVASVVKALAPHFADYAIYAPTSLDILLVATTDDRVPDQNARIFTVPALASELKRLGIGSPADLELRRMGRKTLLQPLFATAPVPANSDYFPFLDISAAKSRFLQKNAIELTELAAAPVPALEMLALRKYPGGDGASSPLTDTSNVTARSKALAILANLKDFDSDPDDRKLSVKVKSDVALVRALLARHQCAAQWDLWFVSLYSIATAALPHLTPEETSLFWQEMDFSHCLSTATPSQKRWIALLRAMGQRDAAAMSQLSTALLTENGRSRYQHREFLLAAGMLGSLARSDRDHARYLWDTYRPSLAERLEHPLLFRLLLAHATIDMTSNGRVSMR